MTDDLEGLAAALRERLVHEAGAGEDGDLHGRIRALVDREAGVLDPEAREDLVGRVIERSFGLGALEPLLRDPSVDEVMVNGPAAVFVERSGRIEPAGVAFANVGDLRHAIERILAPLGRRVDEAEPLVDARLPEGSCRLATQAYREPAARSTRGAGATRRAVAGALATSPRPRGAGRG